MFVVDTNNKRGGTFLGYNVSSQCADPLKVITGLPALRGVATFICSNAFVNKKILSLSLSLYIYIYIYLYLSFFLSLFLSLFISIFFFSLSLFSSLYLYLPLLRVWFLTAQVHTVTHLVENNRDGCSNRLFFSSLHRSLSVILLFLSITFSSFQLLVFFFVTFSAQSIQTFSRKHNFH